MLGELITTATEFSSTVLAAVLTIVGYSINATVVILDRVRYNLKMMPEAKKVADTFLDMGKKTLDTATAGPKAVVGDKDVKTFENSSTTWDDVDEYLKEHGMTKDGVSKEFLDELRENLKRNRK